MEKEGIHTIRGTNNTFFFHFMQCTNIAIECGGEFQKRNMFKACFMDAF